MRISRRHAAPFAVVLLAAGAVRAQTPPGQSPQEKQRSEILRELGLKKKTPPATPPDAGQAPATETPEPATGSPGKTAPREKSGAGARKVAPAAAPSFRRAIHPLLVTSCKLCHVAGGAAAASHLLLSGDADADHHAVVRFVDVRDPGASVLLAKTSGTTLHGGGALWPPTSAPFERVLAWIRGGARLDGATPAPEPTAEPATPRVAPSKRVVPAEPAAPEEVPSPASAGPPASTAAASPTPAGFASGVHPILMTGCAACHGRTGPAAATRLVLSGDAAHDEVAARALVDPLAPDRSPLVTKASGEMHGGGAVLSPGDPRLDALLAWASSLAQAPAPSAAVVIEPSPPAPAAVQAPPGHHGIGGHGETAGLALPLGFMLDGRFDLDYERRQFSGDPFGPSSVAALRSYHHFLFLSRDVADDPCGLSVEILTLQFWEAHCRVGPLPAPFRLTVAGGKIVVPFGADPLYHQNYGGLGGFDQRILPVIWAVEGAAAHLVIERGAFVLTDDLFVVRGYALARADAVLNLQNDFSPVDATKVGWGNRVGAAWMFASAWYSAYVNPLGFGRRLFMQAVDLTVWRPRGIPVLGHFSLGAGLLRADVSGGGAGVGGPGKDYYTFGSYFQLRYHPTDWLYVQYRQGLRTFDNRRGVILDNSRLTSADGSTHNFGVVARRRGLTAGLYYFINLEKVNEVRDDLLRLSVTYEF